MSKKELNQLADLLSKFEQRMANKYMLWSGYDALRKIRADIEAEIHS